MIRRAFGKLAGSLLLGSWAAGRKNPLPFTNSANKVIATWNNGTAVETALEELKKSGHLLDAIEAGINTVEANPNDHSVGYGGLPDRSGKPSLDACIMDDKGNAGSVVFLRDIKYAISVARRVMEHTPHVILAGEGAYSFALDQGFKHEDLLTSESRSLYKKWKTKSDYSPKINSERHDTIGMLAINSNSNLSGGCSTSGLAYKMPGRVGDSPIIGSGLFVDNSVGAATATGYGELVLKSCSTFLVVELMRQGFSPHNACRKALERLMTYCNVTDKQVGLIAVNKAGEAGAFALRKGFNYVVATDDKIELFESDYLL